jgi:hypothetical protein
VTPSQQIGAWILFGRALAKSMRHFANKEAASSFDMASQPNAFPVWFGGK